MDSYLEALERLLARVLHPLPVPPVDFMVLNRRAAVVCPSVAAAFEVWQGAHAPLPRV